MLIERTMTEKDLAAHQQNAQQSHGAATPEGKERARSANLRHGYYSQLRNEALAALGENPEELAELVESLREQYCPANVCQTWITDRMASLQWRIRRSERMLESLGAGRLRQVEAKRREASRKMRARWDNVHHFLVSLRGAAARPDFYALNGCLARCAEVREQSPSANLDEILDRLYALRRPHRFTKPAPPPLPDPMSDQDWREDQRGDEDREPCVLDPEIPVAEGKERDPLREQLWNLIGEELRRATEVWEKAIAAQEAPLPTATRDVHVMGNSKQLELLWREERSCAREYARLLRELLRLQKAAGKPGRQSESKGRNHFEAEGREGTGAPSHDDAWPAGASAAVGEGKKEESDTKNAGASGYVEENTETGNSAVVTKCPPDTSQPHPEAAMLHYILNEIRDPRLAPAAAPSTESDPEGEQADKESDSGEEAA